MTARGPEAKAIAQLGLGDLAEVQPWPWAPTSAGLPRFPCPECGAEVAEVIDQNGAPMLLDPSAQAVFLIGRTATGKPLAMRPSNVACVHRCGGKA